MGWKGIFLLQKPPPIWNALWPVRRARILGCYGGQEDGVDLTLRKKMFQRAGPMPEKVFWNELISYKLAARRWYAFQ